MPGTLTTKWLKLEIVGGKKQFNTRAENIGKGSHRIRHECTNHLKTANSYNNNHQMTLGIFVLQAVHPSKQYSK